MWDQKKKANPFGGGDGDDFDFEEVEGVPETEDALDELDAALEKAKELEKAAKEKEARGMFERGCVC